MNRRDFMKTGLIGAAGLMGCHLRPFDWKTIDRIYNDLPNSIYDVYVSGESNGEKVEQKGKGVIANDKFITCAHVTNLEDKVVMTMFGPMPMHFDVKNKKVRIKDLEMEEILMDKKRDVSSYAIPRNRRRDFPNFPAKPSSDRHLGQEVYIIGNPRLKGLNIRKTYISDLDGYGDMANNMTEYAFGVQNDLIPGDSGTPCVSRDFKLMGLNAFATGKGLGYVTKIEEFFK